MDTQGGARADPTELPSLVQGLGCWTLFPERRDASGGLVEDGVSIVGSEELDRFLTVPSRRVAAIRTVLRVAGECRGQDELTARLRGEGLSIDVPGLYDKLRDAGLVLDGAGQPVAADSPLERNFVRVARVDLAPLASFFLWCGRHLLGIAGTLVALAIVGSAPGLRRSLDPLSTAFGTEALGWSGVVTGLLLLGGSVLIHEMCHGTVAARFGRPPRRLEMGFYLGFLPTFFLRVGGLYTLSPRRRIAVWAAGPTGSLGLAATAAWLVLYTDAPGVDLWTRLAYLNLGLGLYNLVPFLPTDGYFILSTLLRRTNVRKRAWSSLRAFLAGGRRPALLLCLYVAGFSAVVMYLLGGRLLRVVHDFPEHPLDATLRFALTVTLVGLVVFRWRRAEKARAARRQALREGLSSER